MQVIGVLDLNGSRAVHARAGQRELYQPVREVAGSPIVTGDAVALARAYVERLGVSELYAADLDAILSGRDRAQEALVAAVAAVGPPLWLDAGVSSVDQARRALGLGAAHVVIGLETLSSYDLLGKICNELGGERVAFSLDLRDGQPIVASGMPTDEPANVIATRASDAGVEALIVIDLARVGTNRGLDLALIAGVRKAAPGLTLLAGGGVRGVEDLAQLAGAGCDGALVATALHDGRLSAADVANAAHRSVTR